MTFYISLSNYIERHECSKSQKVGACWIDRSTSSRREPLSGLDIAFLDLVSIERTKFSFCLRNSGSCLKNSFTLVWSIMWVSRLIFKALLLLYFTLEAPSRADAGNGQISPFFLFLMILLPSGLHTGYLANQVNINCKIYSQNTLNQRRESNIEL